MNLIKKAVVALFAAAVPLTGIAIGGSHAEASSRPAVLGYGQHGCTYTSPEYNLANQNTRVQYYPGGYGFSSWHEGSGWESAYLVTGFSRGNNSNRLCGSYGHYSYNLPSPVSGPVVTGRMSYSVKGNGARPGWDIWLVPNSRTSADQTATAMEHDRNVLEIMIQPGGGVTVNNPSRNAFHRVYIGAGSLGRSFSLSHYAGVALKAAHLNYRNYSWQAIDGGWESPSGSFRLSGYGLWVYAYTSIRATATARATAVYRGHRVTKSVRVTSSGSAYCYIKGSGMTWTRAHTLAARTAIARARSAAAYWAGYQARHAAAAAARR